MCYTLQWLAKPDEVDLPQTPKNMDATFKKYNRKKKPSDLLLHYNYGAAAVKWWEHGAVVLENRPNLPCPAVPTLAPMGPSRPLHDRVIQKLDATQGADQAHPAHVVGGDQPGEVMEGQATWDEDDIILFFWENSPAAIERHHKKQEERSQYIEQWRSAVA